MTQPLNYTIRAIEGFAGFESTSAPMARAGFRYLSAKLREAQVFLLPELGQLLDRSKVRPEVPGLVFRPAFPVMALEYQCPSGTGRDDPVYCASPCSRRIALAWDWTCDLPRDLQHIALANFGPGVVIASIAYYDDHAMWMPVPAAIHLPYDGEWLAFQGRSHFHETLVANGGLSRAQVKAKTYGGSLVPLLPEALIGLQQAIGPDAALDHIRADLMDEANAYTDLCFALGCKNVNAIRAAQPEKLNRSRIKAGKLPLKDFHVLRLSEHDGTGSSFGGAGASGTRSHLRRGHIRRLGPARMTWVNQTMVHGRRPGFVDKVYNAEASL